MKHTQTKFFIMFLAGILFSVFTVFAATISVNTDFTEDAVQFLQKLVLTDSDGTTTGVLLNGSGESYIMWNIGMGTANPQVKVHIKNDTNNANSVFLVEAFGGEDLLSVDGDASGYPEIKIGDMGDLGGGHYLTVNHEKSYFQNGNVGIGTDSPEKTLDVNGSIKIGSDGDTCTVNNAGTLRYIEDPPGSHLEICAIKLGIYEFRTVQTFSP